MMPIETCTLAQLPSRITASIQRNPLIAEYVREKNESPIQTLMRADIAYAEYHKQFSRETRNSIVG
jgi:hypothetical protein